MIKVIIIDDETKAQDTLELLLDRCLPDKFEVLAKCGSVDEGISKILHKKPDILFLDIQMPHKNGFALFDELKQINFDIVFTTAYKEHAVKAINMSNRVFGYLLKPIDSNELRNLLIRYEEKREQESLSRKMDKLADLGILAYSTLEEIDFIQHDEIIFCEAGGNYTTIHKTDGTQLMVSKNLKVIEERLPVEQFIRIHNGLLVNIKQVSKIDKKDDYMVLRNGKRLSVSTRKMKDIKKYFAY